MSANGKSDWGVRTQEHTFSTGRSATLRASLPVTELVRQGVFDDENLSTLDDLIGGEVKNAQAALRLSDAICVGMFVDPKLAVPDDEGNVPDGHVPVGALDENEIAEVLDLALSSVASAAGFRGVRDRPDGGADSKSVGVKTKRPSRARAGKPGGSRGRQKSGGKAR